MRSLHENHWTPTTINIEKFEKFYPSIQVSIGMEQVTVKVKQSAVAPIAPIAKPSNEGQLTISTTEECVIRALCTLLARRLIPPTQIENVEMLPIALDCVAKGDDVEIVPQPKGFLML